MSTYTEEVGHKLNQLLEKTYDAEKGFNKAAENTENESLANYFTSKAEERYSFGKQLKEEIKSFNAEINKGGSTTGTVHRAWMDVKALFSMETEESMLEEAIRGEKAAIKEYDDILAETSLPESTKTILTSQKQKIEYGLSNIRTLENSY
jgi:uncharacterized protein (TIGR02284 family)